MPVGDLLYLNSIGVSFVFEKRGIGPRLNTGERHDTINSTISPLRQRMIEDMTMRKLAPKTQASYICAVKKLADHMGHSPHTR